MTTQDWPMSIDQLERIAAAQTGRNYAAERRETEATMRLCDELEQLDKERAADEIEELQAGYKDPLTGLPPAGMESPRFRTDRELEYMDWVGSEEGARTRRNVHPKYEDRLRRQGATATGPYLRQHGPQPDEVR